VIWRESWQLGPDEIDLLAGGDGLDGYLSGRRLAGRLGLPRHCFVRLSTRRKPLFVDFTNPVSVTLLTRAVAGDRRRAADLEVAVSEMLPGPDEVWLADHDGNRYLGEVRLHVTDPVA
jgi:hypothetical protein